MGPVRGAWGRGRRGSRADRGEQEALLEVLFYALLDLRSAGWSGDAARAATLADAFHNLPHLISGRVPSWTVEDLRRIHLPTLLERYPEAASVDQGLERIARAR